MNITYNNCKFFNYDETGTANRKINFYVSEANFNIPIYINSYKVELLHILLRILNYRQLLMIGNCYFILEENLTRYPIILSSIKLYLVNFSHIVTEIYLSANSQKCFVLICVGVL